MTKSLEALTTLDETIACLKVREQIVPEGVFGEKLGIANDDESVGSASNGHVEAAGVSEKANALHLVGANARQDHKLLFSALERVHRSHFDARVHRPVREAPVIFEIISEVRALSLVCANNADLLRLNVSWWQQEFTHNFLDLPRLFAIQVTAAVAAHFLFSIAVDEKHGALRH